MKQSSDNGYRSDLAGVLSRREMLERSAAGFGMLGLMFMVGFEIDVNRLCETWRASVGIGVMALLLPAAGVYLLSPTGCSTFPC